MEKVKLSSLIYEYEQKSLKKEELFDMYFEEQDVEEKLEKLQNMYETLGDISMPINHFKTFMFTGLYDKQFVLTKEMISDIYDIIKYYDDMPVKLINKLLVHYDEECFKEFDVKGYVHELIKQYNYSDKTEEMYIDYMDDKKTLIKKIYVQESKKLDSISDQYKQGFIEEIKNIIKNRHLRADNVIKLLPEDSFFKPNWNYESEYTAKRIDYSFIYELLKGKICLDDYTDEEYIPVSECVFQTKQGIETRKIYTSFTKKEYLDQIVHQKTKKLIKKIRK